MTTVPVLPGGWQLVHPIRADLQRVTDHLIAYDIAITGQADTTLADVEYEWNRSGFKPETDAWLLFNPNGKLVGYTDFWVDETDLYIVHNTSVMPEFTDQISPWIFYQMGIERAREMGPEKIKRIRTITISTAAEEMLAGHGFKPIQVQWRMNIELTGQPQQPVWPEGYRLRSFDRERDAREVFDVIETAFSELPHRHGNTFEGWQTFILERSDFEPELLKVVVQGDEVAAAAVGFDDPIGGWVRQLAVKKSHRGKGLATNLLREFFCEFHRRGRASVGLTVDSENRTGAPELYQSVGMQPTEKYVTFVMENR
jgi:mycothiol synthase